MIKILVTNNTIYQINYLRFTENIRKKSLFFGSVFDRSKKIFEKKVYSTFVTVTVILSLTLSTIHSILSPALTSKAWAMLTGTLVLTELLLVAPLLIVVFCLNNNTITSNLLLVILIFVLMTI